VRNRINNLYQNPSVGFLEMKKAIENQKT